MAKNPVRSMARRSQAAARAQGMDYVAIPVGHSGMGEPQIVAMRDAVYGATGEAVHEEESGGKGKVLAYCRSGTRSTLLWALAMAHGGMALNEIAAAAARGGYDVAPVRPRWTCWPHAARRPDAWARRCVQLGSVACSPILAIVAVVRRIDTDTRPPHRRRTALQETRRHGWTIILRRAMSVWTRRGGRRLLWSDDGTIMAVRTHGAHYAGRILGDRARARPGDRHGTITVDTGDRAVRIGRRLR